MLWLWDTDLRETDASLLLDALHLELLFLRPKRDAGASFAGPGGPARAVDVRLRVVRRLNLNDQVDVRDVEAS